MEIKCPEQGATLLRGVFQQPVNANDIIVISVECALEPLTPPIRALFTNGKYNFTVSAAMKNEAYR